MRNTRRWLLGLVVVGVTACGSDEPDYAPLFAGSWYGQANYTFTGQGGTSTDTQQVQQPIVVLGKNHLRLAQYCSGSDPGPEADVTSPTQFQVRSYSCTIAVGACQATLTVTGGDGTLSGQTLTINFQGTLAIRGGGSCQAETTQYAINFNGSHNNPSQSGQPPVAPTDLAVSRADAYGTFVLSWGSSSSAQLSNVQARIGNGSYLDVPSYYYGPAGLTVQLDQSALPERTTVSFRIRVSNSAGVSGFSNEASASSALLPPTLQQAQQVSTGMQLTWVPRSDVTALVVERSDIQNASAYAVVGSAAAGQSAFVDTSITEGGYYYYRIHWVDGALEGYPSYSYPIPTSLLPPSDLVAVGGGERVDLSWTNHSHLATEVDVYRADGLIDYSFGTLVAQLPASATSFTDLVPSGIYSYRVEAHATTVGGNGSALAYAATLPPDSPSSWSVAFADQSPALRAVMDSAGRYLFWGQDLALRRSDGAPEIVRAPSASLPIPFPYFVLDASEHPHLVYLRQTVQGGSTMAVLHDWFDGSGWNTEEVGRLAGQSYAFALDLSGHPVVAVSGNGAAEGMRVIRWSGSAYLAENPNLTFTQGTTGLSNYLLAMSSAGRVHLVAETFIAETVHAWRDGTWSQEPVALSSTNAVIGRLAAFGDESLALVCNDFGAISVLVRGSVGWTAPMPIASGGGLFNPADAVLAVATDGSSPALLLNTSGGLQLARASEGWVPHVLTSSWPIVGFGHDAAGKLYALVAGGQNFSVTPPVTHAVIFREQ